MEVRVDDNTLTIFETTTKIGTKAENLVVVSR